MLSLETSRHPASDADTPEKGCFFERDPKTIESWRHSLPMGRGKTKDFLVIPSPGYRATLLQSSLNSRGWVLQESILAPRILRCTASQLYWECPSTASCEVFPVGIPRDLYSADLIFRLRGKLAVFDFDSGMAVSNVKNRTVEKRVGEQ